MVVLALSTLHFSISFMIEKGKPTRGTARQPPPVSANRGNQTPGGGSSIELGQFGPRAVRCVIRLAQRVERSLGIRVVTRANRCQKGQSISVGSEGFFGKQVKRSAVIQGDDFSHGV
jgi:hypothetical protein